MRGQTLEGIVIKRANVGEADKLITLFSKTQGKVTLVAKGIRKTSSRRSGSLELFNLVKVGTVPGKGQREVLTEVVPLQNQTNWRKHLGRVNIAYQLVETIDKLTPENQPHPYIFELLVTALSQIGALDKNWQEQLEVWLVAIIRELGFYPENKPFEGDIYNFIEQISERPLNSPKLLKKLR